MAHKFTSDHILDNTSILTVHLLDNTFFYLYNLGSYFDEHAKYGEKNASKIPQNKDKAYTIC